MEYTEEENIPALLISIDFEKCYDRIEWKAMEGALIYYNFGSFFIKMVKTLYKNIQSCTQNNGFSSTWFSPTRGLRQGCPASSYIFLLVAEILATNIRKNANIKGITINGTEKKISQFADDTNIFIHFDKNSLQGVTDAFVEFQNNTGLKVNYDKTSIYRIGSIKNTKAMLYTNRTYTWTNNDIEILGVT